MIYERFSKWNTIKELTVDLFILMFFCTALSSFGVGFCYLVEWMVK